MLLFSESQFTGWISGLLSCWARLVGLWLFKILTFCCGCISYISCQVYYLAWCASLGKYFMLWIHVSHQKNKLLLPSVKALKVENLLQTTSLYECSGYKPVELKECVLMLHDLFLSRKGAFFRAVRDKYKQKKVFVFALLLL